MEQGLVVLHFLFPANEQAAKPVHPGVSPFDHPTSGPVSRNRRFFFLLLAARTQMKHVSPLGCLFPDDRNPYPGTNVARSFRPVSVAAQGVRTAWAPAISYRDDSPRPRRHPRACRAHRSTNSVWFHACRGPSG